MIPSKPSIDSHSARVHRRSLTCAIREKLERFVTMDFFPELDPYLDWVRSPLGALLLTAVAGLLCGLFVAPQGLVLSGSILVLISLGLIWPWLCIKGVTAQLAFTTQRATEATEVGVTVAITNRWPWPVWGLSIEQGFFDTSSGGQPTAALAQISGWTRDAFDWQFTPAVRGVYPSIPPQLVCSFPFGLWKARRTIEVTEPLLVWPATFWLPPCPVRSGAESWRGEAGCDRSGHEGERCGVRLYRHGDSLRLIHWPATSRLGRFIVCERQSVAETRVCVDATVDPNIHNGAGGASSREWTIRIAASICDAFLTQGCSVICRFGTKELAVYPGRECRDRFFDALACLDMPSEEPMDRPFSTTSRAAYESASIRFVVTTDQAAKCSNAKHDCRLERRVVLMTSAFVVPGLATQQRAQSVQSAPLNCVAINRIEDIPCQLLAAWRRRKWGMEYAN